MSTKLMIAVAFIAIFAGSAIAGDQGVASRQRHDVRHGLAPKRPEWKARSVPSSAYASVAWPVRAMPPASEAQGQYPAPPAIAAQSALPDCGFAAIESWGPNGFQYCDSRNVHDDAASGYDRPDR